MSADVVIIHAGEQPPLDAWQASIFLAGPNPRDTAVPSWRPAALDLLRQLWDGPGTLAVFVPEGRGWQPLHYDRHEWEYRWLSIVDVILFWVPREMTTMPALNTNIEFGRWENSGRIVLGAPPAAQHVTYLIECAQRHSSPTASTIHDTVAAALEVIGSGAHRALGHRDVPLALWRDPTFATWLEGQQAQGRELRGGRVLWINDTSQTGSLRHWVFQARFADGIQELAWAGEGRI